MKIFPIYYCICCKGCRYYKRNKMKSLFDAGNFLKCSDSNGMNITPIIPKVLYIIDWCKMGKYNK